MRSRTYASPCRAMLVLISAQTQGVFGKLKRKGFSPGPNTRCFRSLIDHKWFSRGYCALAHVRFSLQSNARSHIGSNTRGFRKAETQGVFSRPKHEVFSLADRSQVVFTRLLCAVGFVKNRTTNVSIRRTNRRLHKVNRVFWGPVYTIILMGTDTFVSFFGCSFTMNF